MGRKSNPSSARSRQWALRAYILSLFVLLLVLLHQSAASTDRSFGVVELIIWWLAYVLAEWTPVEVPLGPINAVSTGQSDARPSLSAGFLVLLTVGFVDGPRNAIVVGVLGALSPRDWRGIKRTVFNLSQMGLYSGAAAILFEQGKVAYSSGFAVIATAVLAALAASILNVLFVACVLTLDLGWNIGRSIKELVWPVPHSIGFALAALLVSKIYDDFGIAAVFFLIVPLVVLRQVRMAKVGLDLAHEHTLRALVRAVEMKDPYTRLHSERVASLVVAIHHELGTEPEDLRLRFYGAMLHDLGKVGVDGRVLTKPGRLTSCEFAQIKEHPRIGAVALQEVDFLSGLIPEILYHHERLDGSGYPIGLSGSQIPFAARVLSVADTYEALTSDRPYRPALTSAEALSEMRRVAGKQLEPEFIEHLSKAIERDWTLAAPRHSRLQGEPILPSSERMSTNG